MKDPSPVLTSMQNPKVKQALRLRKRSDRDETGLMLIEGYREILRALEGGHPLHMLFYSPSLFLGHNEPALLERAAAAGAALLPCSATVLSRLAYRDRPEGLLAVAPQVRRTLSDIPLSSAPLLLVAEAIEKPGNLGTMLRSADAAGANGVVVCDRCTDVNNPNVVRASLGTLFSVPVAEASSEETLDWLRVHRIRAVAASPHAQQEFTAVDLTGGVAFVVGTEQYGLSERWMKAADIQVRIPMLGRADSLNVAAATTLLLYEAVRQRRSGQPSG